MSSEHGIIVKEMGLARASSTRVCLVQIETFQDQWTHVRGLPQLSDNTALWPQVEDALRVAHNHAADLIIFPELSIPEVYISRINEWSRQTNSVVIAGTHYSHRSMLANAAISRCPVITPQEVILCHKLTPSPYERSPCMGEGLSSGLHTVVLRNSPAGDVGILICADYLNPNMRQTVLGMDLDILCILACQRDSSRYHARMNIDCEDSEHGIYLIYSNLSWTGVADGRSALFGVMDRIYTRKLRDVRLTDLQHENKLIELPYGARCCIVDLDIRLKRPALPRTIHSRPNISVIGVEDISGSEQARFAHQVGRYDERYLRLPDYFVPPAEYDQMYSKLEAHKLLFITGDPGIGKTYTAAALLRDYYARGFSVAWHTGESHEERASARRALEDLNPGTMEIHYFEDPFGRVVYERREFLHRAFRPLRAALKHANSRVIVTSRSQIFEVFAAENLGASELAQYREEMNVVKPSYSSAARGEILCKLARVHARWGGDDKCLEAAQLFTERSGIVTPLGIRDLILSTQWVESLASLNDVLASWEDREPLDFAEELRTLPVESQLLLVLAMIWPRVHSAHLQEWYDSVLLREEPGRLQAGITFSQALRNQIGHRLEHVGPDATRIDFTHPKYGAAVCTLVEHDADARELARMAVRRIAESGSDTASKIVFGVLRRYGTRHIGAAKVLVGAFAQAVGASENPIEKVRCIRHLLATYHYTEDESFIQMAKDLASIDDLVRLVSLQGQVIGPDLSSTLRTTMAYAYTVLGLEPRSLGQRIDWPIVVDKVLSWASKGSPREIMDALDAIWAASKSAYDLFFRTAFDMYFRRLPYLLAHADMNRLKGIADEELRKDIIAIVVRAKPNQRILRRALKERLDRTEPAPAIVVDTGACLALQTGRYSLLPVGVVEVAGYFLPGEIVQIISKNGNLVAAGVAEYSSDEIRSMRGRRSAAIPRKPGKPCCVVRQQRIMLKIS